MYKYRTYTLKLNKEKDKELIEYLERQRTITEAIRRAITEAIKAERKEGI